MRMNPTVSIIIPAFKQAGYLPAAIDSALGQSGLGEAEVEVIVVDDGCPEGTPEVCRQYGDRIVTFRKANAGLPAARNTGILASRGEFLLWLDSDDLLPLDAVGRHLETLRRTGADVAYCDYHYIDPEGRVGKQFQAFVPETDAAHQYLLGNMFPPHAAMTRRTAIANSGLFDVHLRSFEDWDFWLRLAFAGAKFARTEGVSVPYRQHPASMSKNADRMRRSGMQVLDKARVYHANCEACRRGIRAGRWGLRRHYLSLMNSSGGTPAVAQAALHDPAILVSPIREAMRDLKHKLRPTPGGEVKVV